MTVAKPCPHCGRRPVTHTSYLVTCRCPNCYDGSEDAHPGSQLCGFGETVAQAVESWNERVSEVDADEADAPEECENNDCTGCPWCDAHGITREVRP